MFYGMVLMKKRSRPGYGSGKGIKKKTGSESSVPQCKEKREKKLRKFHLQYTW
jgi:hypothetical protein